MGRKGQSVVFLDTHIVVWLYAGLIDKISDIGKKAIDDHEVVFSPMVKLEMQYLLEIGRIKVKPHTIIRDSSNSIGLAISDNPLDLVIEEAMQIHWTRDVFDRMLSAEAQFSGAGFVTADQVIRSNLRSAIW
jgi:PIN domain nuclease of toxin-antitoxin system